jgi:hypothetical protein
MTSFDELVGTEPTGAERERLRDVHDLLWEAGPPPEVPPELLNGPTLAMTLSRSRARLDVKRRRLPILTIAAAVLVGLIIGVGAALHRGQKYPSIAMRGESIAAGASGTLELLPPARSGARQRMLLEVTGLPPSKTPYVVYLVRNGRRVASCGRFVVSSTGHRLTEHLTSPYATRSADTWIVTIHTLAGTTTVLQPVA